MEISEFIEASSRVEQYYGKEFSKEQRMIIFEELKSLDIARYRKLISEVLRKSKFLPKIADFIEANTELPYSVQLEDKQKVDCKKCNSTGYIIYTKIIKDGSREIRNQYGCICSCGNSRKYEGWNVSDKRYKTDYYTPLASELRL